MNKLITIVIASGLVVATTACQQTPVQAPQGPPPSWGPPRFGPADGPESHDHPTTAGGRKCDMGRCRGMMGGGGRERHQERGEGRRRGRKGNDAMRELVMLGVHFYPPPMLIKRAAKIGLTPDQIIKIRAEVVSAQVRSVDLKAKIEKAKIESVRLLAADKVDEKAVGAQIDEATKAAAELRKIQVGVMVHVRDLLTPDQLKKLEEHKEHHRDAKPADGPGKRAMADNDDDDDDDDDDSDDDDDDDSDDA